MPVGADKRKQQYNPQSDRGIQKDRAGLPGGSAGAVGAHERTLQRAEQSL